MATDVSALVEAVKAHARDNYNEGGWDVIVECWDDDRIAEVIREDAATTPAAAVDAFRPVVGVWADRQADARNSAF